MSYMENLRAPDEDHIIKAKRLRRSITPIHMDAWQYITSASTSWVLFVMMALFAAMFKALSVLVIMLAVTVFLLNIFSLANRGARLPIRLPAADVPDKTDYHDDKPGHEGFFKSRGMFLFGNAFNGKKELWASFSDILTHVLVIGGTGAGKTETLVSMAFNFLALGSGCAYVDPKAAPKLFGQIWYMARMVGRDDDIRTLNFAVGQEELASSPFRRSNTLQPFAFGKAEAIKEIPLSLMAGGDDKSGGGIFAANGKALMTALMMGLVELRNKGEIYLSVNDLRNYLNPDDYVALATRKDLSPLVAEAMQGYLKSMGWKPGLPRDKWGDFDRQHSYAQNYFLEPLSTMADTYRHIFGVKIGDIHMPDIILQRRIFLTLLPSLEKSKKEATALGRITLAQIRLATAVGLGGGEVMGAWDMIVDSSITASRVPFAVITDEYAAIAVDGFAEIFTQGRGLGICGILASQDWAGIKKANEAEAQQIVANTKFKVIMTTDDPNDTRKLIIDLSGEIEEIRTQGYQLKGVINYTDGLSAQAHKTARVDLLDIAAMVEGEFHMFFKDRLIRGQSFFAGGEPEKNKKSTTAMFVHHLLMIERPSEQLISSKFGSLRAIVDKWKSGAHRRMYDIDSAEGFAPVARTFASGHPGGPVFNRIGRRDLAAAAFIAWCDDFVFDSDAWVTNKQSQGEIFTIGDDDELDLVAEQVAISNMPDGATTHGPGDSDGFDPDDEDDELPGSTVAPPAATDEADERRHVPQKADGNLSDLEANDGLLVNAPHSTRRIDDEHEPATHEDPAKDAPNKASNYWAGKDPGESKNLFGEVMEAILGDKSETNFVNAGVHMGETRDDSRDAAKKLNSLLTEAMRTPAYPDKPEPEKTDPRDYKLRLDSWIKKLEK